MFTVDPPYVISYAELGTGSAQHRPPDSMSHPCTALNVCGALSTAHLYTMIRYNFADKRRIRRLIPSMGPSGSGAGVKRISAFGFACSGDHPALQRT